MDWDLGWFCGAIKLLDKRHIDVRQQGFDFGGSEFRILGVSRDYQEPKAKNQEL